MEHGVLARDRASAWSDLPVPRIAWIACSGIAWRSLLLVLALLLATPTWSQELDDDGDVIYPSGMSIAHPGRVLIDSVRRANSLKRQDPSVRRRYCPPTQVDSNLPPVVRLAGAVDESQRGMLDRAVQPFTMAVMQGTAFALAGDDQAARSTIRLLDNWARANALSELVDIGPERNNAIAQYSLRRVMMAVVPSWAILASQADAETKQRVEGWMAQRIAAMDQPVGPAETRKTGQRKLRYDYYQLLREAASMSYAALTGDNERFRRGIALYVAVLRQMRDDGSLPLETAHGSRALWYQRHAIASLVVMAQIADQQGYDLYDVTISGKRLDRAVNFLLAEASEPHQIAAYATENQDLSFLQHRSDGRNFMAWVEPWLAHGNVGPIPDGDPLQIAISARPLIDELVGGNATCLMAPVREP
jgi:poly(beta-D-mannuronate) lyase